jgi:hypothetical protein
MRSVEPFVAISAPLRRDEERRRWYCEAAEGCVVLTRRGRLLEPYPVFGPASYRLLACQVGLAEARAYASSHAFRHERLPPPLTAPP